MKRKAALLSFGISSVMLLGACGGNDVPSGEEAEQELEEYGEQVQEDIQGDDAEADTSSGNEEDLSGDGTVEEANVEGKCADFSDQEEATLYWEENGYTAENDPEQMDIDMDGLPCEDLSGQKSDPDGAVEEQGDSSNDASKGIPEDAVTIEDEVFYASKDYEDAEEYTHSYYAKVKNNTDESYNLDGSSVTWYDENDEMINVTDDYSVWVYPNILMPGEEALIEVTEDYMVEDNIGDVELLLSPSPAGSDYKTEYLDIEKVSISDRPAVVGQYTNTLDEEAGNAYVASAFYNSDDELVGVSALQVHDLISPGEITAFEYGLPSMTSEAYESIEYEETEAFELQGYAQAE